MGEFENGQRFKRDMMLKRVKLHLAQRRDAALPLWAFEAVLDAYTLVNNVHREALDEDLRALGAAES